VTVIDLSSCHRNTRRGRHCGYCKGSKGNPGHADWGITSYRMTVVDYQKMMDRGWRRCGCYYYKYDFLNSCCQPYTIRLDTKEYAISHSQKKVMKRFNKFLCGEIDEEGKNTTTTQQEEEKKDTMKVDKTEADL
jgi:arginyl-tRNA---protein transferase